MDSRHRQGKEAEQKALQWFLENKNCYLIAQNYRCRVGEIDLILEEKLPLSSDPELVFVEVRSRSKGSPIDGPQGIDLRKQRALKRAIRSYLVDYRGRARTLRLDLLYWDGQSWLYLNNLWLS